MEAAAPTITLDQRLADITGALNVLHGELVTVVADIKERSLWAGYGGIRSLTTFTDGRGSPLVRPKPNPPAVPPTPPAAPYKHPLGQRLYADNLAFILPEPQNPN
jgi:hypothetical protein